MHCCRRVKIRSGSQSSLYLNVPLSQRKHNDSQTHQKSLEIHNQLLEFIKANDIENIRHLINEHNELLTMKYPHPYFKSIIPIARFNFFRCIDMRTMKTLIQLGFQINNASNRIEELIFFAAASGHKEKLNDVLEYIRKNCPEMLNNTREGDTALMFLIKYGDPTTPEFVECAKILVQANIDVNIPDYSNCSPIVRAAYLYHTHEQKPKSVETDLFLASFREVVKIILHKGNVDLDSHKWYEKTAREYIGLSQICQIPKQTKAKSTKQSNIKSKLFALVIAKQEKKIANVKKVKSYDLDDGENTLLQLAVLLKLEATVKFFLKKGADPNKTTKRNKDTPLEMAAKRNHHNIFEILLNWPATIITQEIYRYFATRKGNKIKEKFFEILLRSPKLNVDFICKSGNTPLHYAAMASNNEVVLELLKRGASLVVENHSHEKPVDYIDPRVMKKFIDQCVESKSSLNIYHRKSTLSFNYQFLLKNKRESVGSNRDSFVEIEDIDREFRNERFASETEAALTISELPEIRNLLKHPVISSFLYVKWYKIKAFFYIVMLFHAWCYLSFLNYFYQCSRYDNSQLHATFWIFIFSYVAYVGFIITRIIVNRGDLNMHFHIYIECCLVILILITLCLPSVFLRKHFSVFGILLAAFSLIFWMGYHPRMSTHVAMLQRVSYNFFKILLCYCILIMAFGLSFYILFNNYKLKTIRKNDTEVVVANDTTEDEGSFFINPGTAIFKTFVMMTGEYETSEFKFHKSEVSSYIIFLLFVFMISLILMNLLTGVAVADTETIQNEAEIVGHISTIRFIRFIEVVLQPSFYPRALSKTKLNVNNCFIFPHLSDNKLSFYPNQRGKVQCHPKSPLHCLRITKHIAKDAVNIVIKREIKFNKLLENENFIGAEDLKVLQAKIEEIAERQRTNFKKVQDSIEQISHNLNMITSNFDIVAE